MQKRIIVLLLSSVMLLLAATAVVAAASQYPVSEDFITGNSSYNNSSISFIGQNIITGAPVDLSAGSGYYSSHPIAVGSANRQPDRAFNANSATSMSHEVGSAREVSGRTEYAATSSSRQGEYENINFATTQMQIDETVTSGKVAYRCAFRKRWPCLEKSGHRDRRGIHWHISYIQKFCY